MPGISRHSWLAMLLLAICNPLWAQGALDSVVIVKSSDNAYYDQTIETLTRHADPEVDFETVLVGVEPAMKNPELYIALGQSAVDSVADNAGKIPVINAYLTLEQFRQLPQNSHLTVLLDQPLDRYLAFSKLTLQIDSIGVMTENQIQLNPREQELLGGIELALNQYQLTPEKKLLPTLRHLLETSDALLMLPRQSIYNRDSLKGVLLTSYRGSKPVISYSPAHVKSGALASIYSSPVDIGRHVSILVNDLAQERKFGKPGFRYARFYSIAYNSSVAQALDLKLPSKSELRKQLDGLLQ